MVSSDRAWRWTMVLAREGPSGEQASGSRRFTSSIPFSVR
jgi:hypothetical protein